MEKDIIKTEIVEDMPNFDDIPTEMPREEGESVDERTDDSENAILNEETEAEPADTNAEKAEEDTESTETKDDTTEDEKADEKGKEKADTSNLPAGFTFNPLVIAIRPLLEKAMAEDKLFADEVKEKEAREKNPKSLAECAEYLMGEAYEYASKNRQGNFGLAGMYGDMMVGLIKHYYDEDDIKIRKITNARAKVATAKASAPKKDVKKAEKPKNNVVDITKAITASTKKEDGKKEKREKKKDNLKAGFVPMERPSLENYEKEGKKGSREQAKSVEQMDLFAGFFDEGEE